jgi:NADH-quinone oxidoreductase subunit N
VLLYAGLALLLVGLLFKAGIAPFHSWTPDVYQGAPTPITAFMASCTKVAAFGAILRVLFVGFGTTSSDWRPIIWAVAIASMVVGAVFGLTQTDVKRILAYSSIAHAGFILVGMVALNKDGISSVLFYVLTYGFTTLAAFGLLMVVRDADGEATHLSQWSGLARKSPVVAIVMTILLMSMAGIPLTAGFTGKFFVFRAAYHVAGPLVVIALICSAIAAFYYLRIIVLMFFAEPPENGPTIAIPGWSTSIALTFGVVATIFLGVFPQPILDLATKAAHLTG